MGTTWHDREGHEIDVAYASALLGNPDYRRVAHTMITSADDAAIKHRVSTVWLGLDHNWAGGPPLIFETMVFSGDDNCADQLCRRYSDELAAKLGHEETVILVAATVPGEIIEHRKD